MDSSTNAVDSPRPARNYVFIATRHPLRTVGLGCEPTQPARWLLVRVLRGPSIRALHLRNQVTDGKRAYLEAVLALCRHWRRGRALIGGDSNTGIAPPDGNTAAFRQFEQNWSTALGAQRWFELTRWLARALRVSTYYSPKAGFGYRLAQTFAYRRLIRQISGTKYHCAGPLDGSARREAVSDHATRVVGFVGRGAGIIYSADANLRSFGR